MDGSPDGHSTIWSRIGKIFGRDDEESLEKTIIEASAEGEVEPDEESMLLGILRFSDLQVQDTMTPRTDIDCVPEDSPLSEAARVIVDSGHTRIPVYRETRDNMVGILHAKDVLRSLLEPDGGSRAAGTIMRDLFFVPETKPIRTLLQEFRARKQHMAIALDEYGGTSGLITIEDVLEEIVGEIRDEYDADEEEAFREIIPRREYVAQGSMKLDDLNELMQLGLESEENDTLGGYIMEKMDRLPKTGEAFTTENGIKLRVEKREKNRIAMVRIYIPVDFYEKKTQEEES